MARASYYDHEAAGSRGTYGAREACRERQSSYGERRARTWRASGCCADLQSRSSFRVLRPGGVLICSDSLASDLHHFHEGDTYNPVEPTSVLGRLQTLGFEKITVTVDEGLKFVAHKPG
jgi:hypothetical protein